jgi:hypothetical protein
MLPAVLFMSPAVAVSCGWVLAFDRVFANNLVEVPQTFEGSWQMEDAAACYYC